MLKAQKALQELKNENVVIKMVESKPDDNQHWTFLLNQLKNPGKVRPVKKLRPTQNRSQVWDAAQQKWIYRKTDGKRGAPKATLFIKKTAMTLPPADGRMIFYNDEHSLDHVGIGFRITHESGRALVQIKPKYIFPENIRSNDAPWIYDSERNNFTQASPNLVSTTLDGLRTKNRDARTAGQIPKWRELEGSPSQEGSLCLRVQNRHFCRLNMLRVRGLIESELNETLGLTIMGAETDAKEYTLRAQLKDIVEGYVRLTPGTDSHTNFVKGRPEFENKLRTTLSAINYSNLFAPYLQELSETLKNPGELHDAIGKLILTLYKAGEDKKLIAFLQSIPLPIQSKDLNDCLHLAVSDNKAKIVALLLEKGADVNYSLESIRALSLTVKHNFRDVFSEFMKLDASRFEEDTLQQALLFASNMKKEADAEWFASALFAKKSFNPNKWRWLATEEKALHTAVRQNYSSVVKLICKNEGDAELQAKAPSSAPLDIALANKRFDLAGIMLNHAKLTGPQRGKRILDLLRAEEYSLVKKILNSGKDVVIEGFGADFKDLIENIANDKTLSERAKQTLALYFINKSFADCTNTQGVLHLVSLLARSPAKTKAFLFQPKQGGTNLFHHWNGDDVCSFWSAIMKLAKNRILDISEDKSKIHNHKEVSDFLDTRRLSLGFSSRTKSFKIFEETDMKKRAKQIDQEQQKVAKELQKNYGFVRSFKIGA